jgi:hypothetical protein
MLLLFKDYFSVVMYYTLTYGDFTATKKMIIIEKIQIVLNFLQNRPVY